MTLDPSAVFRVMDEIWRLTTGQSLTASTRVLLPGADWLVAGVQITGMWRGTVTVACPPPLMSRLAAKMNEVPEAEVTSWQRDETLGELANMLGGNLKAILPVPCYLSHPAVSVGDGFDPIGVSRTQVIRVGFEDDGWPFVVTVAETTAAAKRRKHRHPERPSNLRGWSGSDASGRFPRPM